MRIFCVSPFLLLALLFPVAAAAKTIPPGNSGADQYAETLPGAGGNHPTHSGGAGDGSDAKPSKDVLSAAAQSSLEDLGPAGRATADLAESTAPSKHGQAATPNNPSGSSGFLDVVKQAGGSSESGGMGIVLPLILAASALGAVVSLRARRRNAEDAGDAEGTG